MPAVDPQAGSRPDGQRSGSRGVPITVLATVTLAELCAGSGVVTAGHGQFWSVQQLLTMAADMAVAPVVLDHRGAVLAFGRTRRLASAAQRLALAARDRGCVFVGCDRPAAWCQAHHVVDWADGGPTDVDNMCLLCTWHHAHFRTSGWQVIMQDGLPHCIPPPWLDPSRTPVRNTAHCRPEIDFRAPPG